MAIKGLVHGVKLLTRRLALELSRKNVILVLGF